MISIIFGANGQDGYYLKKLLSELGYTIIAVSRSKGYVSCDISDYHAVAELIKKHKPQFIFHFAANSTTQHEALFENHSSISTGTLNILEAVRLYSPLSKVFISGSGLQFLNNNTPIKESDPFEAKDAYSVSRIQSVYASRYFRSLGLKVYVGYFFNHDSPLRSERHMSKKIVESAKRIAQGSKEKLFIGDMDVIKEWTFAGDVMNAVWLMVNQETIFESVIGSGLGYSIKEWASVCFEKLGLHWETFVINNATDFKSPYRKLISDPLTIFSLGWKPKVSLDELSTMMINSFNE